MSWQSTPLAGFQDIGQTRRQFAERDRRAPAARRARIARASSIAASSRWRCVNVGAVRGRDLADLARDELQPAAVERAAERHRHRPGAVPAQLHDGRLVAGDVERGRKPGRRGAGVKHEVAIGRRRVGRRERQRRAPAANSRARRIDVDQRHLGARRSARRETPTSAPTTPAPTTAMRPDGPGARVPDGVERRLHVGGEHRALQRHVRPAAAPRPRPAGRTRSGADAAQRRCGRCSAAGPGLDRADRRVAIFHRERETRRP